MIAAAPPVLHHVQPVMGTAVSYTVWTETGQEERAQRGLAAACARLDEADEMFSTWRPASAVSRLRQGRLTPAEAPPQVREVLALCAWAREASAGWFDPWAIAPAPDPTGLVKGWAAERAAAVLASHGVTGAMVNAGGDIAMVGQPGDAPDWRVGVRDPWQPQQLACVLALPTDRPQAVATSAGYERGAHLLDPRSGQATRGQPSATVVGPSLAVADALATALAVGGARVLALVAAQPGYSGYLVIDRERALAGAGLPLAPP